MAGSIDGLSSQLYNQINSASTNSSAGLESKLDGKDYSKASDEELMDVCREFESYFLEQMFKNMKKMVPKDDAESQYAQSLYDYYEENLVQTYSKQAVDSGQGIGLAKQLYEQMKRNYDL